MRFEELYRMEMELRTFHQFKGLDRRVADPCREQMMTDRIPKKKKPWVTGLIGIVALVLQKESFK
ncbi:hypothetical protein [Paenibacillus caui]|uniref:hypothetical protein n=1 Tax=Paenibacillus caui TaxID=2873927 RepID=UPI001CA882AC|nr:hypothetical protein [Paenibacillus caui]